VNCRAARAAIVETNFGPLDLGVQDALSDHVGACSVCAALAREEAGLDAALSLLRSDPPFEIDVAERVLAAIESLDAPTRQAVPWRQVGWAALAAAVLAVGVLVSGAFLAPSMLAILRYAGKAAVETGVFLAGLGLTAVGALGGVTVLLGAAWDLLTVVCVLIRGAEPLFRGAGAVLVLTMLTVTTWVIGRDFRARVPVGRR